MKPMYETQTVQSCIFVEYENGSKGIVMPDDQTTMLMHLNGSPVVLNNEEEPKKFNQIKPLLYTGFKDKAELDIYDYDKLKYVDNDIDVTGYVYNVNGIWTLVEGENKHILSEIVSKCEKLGNLMFDLKTE